jgi:hypothetical protein
MHPAAMWFQNKQHGMCHGWVWQHWWWHLLTQSTHKLLKTYIQHKMCCTSNLYRQEFNVRVELHFALHLAQTIPCIYNNSIMQNPRTQSFNLVFNSHISTWEISSFNLVFYGLYIWLQNPIKDPAFFLVFNWWY